MTKEMTNKSINVRFDKVVRLGYARVQHLFALDSRAGYNSGVYGWNSDFYIIDNVAISTGYRPTGNIKVSNNKELNNLIDKLDNQAYEINKNYNDTWEIKHDKLKALQNELIDYINTKY